MCLPTILYPQEKENLVQHPLTPTTSPENEKKKRKEENSQNIQDNYKT